MHQNLLCALVLVVVCIRVAQIVGSPGRGKGDGERKWEDMGGISPRRAKNSVSLSKVKKGPNRAKNGLERDHTVPKVPILEKIYQ